MCLSSEKEETGRNLMLGGLTPSNLHSTLGVLVVGPMYAPESTMPFIIAIVLMVLFPAAFYLVQAAKGEKNEPITAIEKIKAWDVIAQGPEATIKHLVSAKESVEALQQKVRELEAELENKDILARRHAVIRQQIMELEEFLEKQNAIFQELIVQLREMSKE